MLFKDKLKEPVIYKGSNKAINELNQIQEYLKTHTSKELEKKARLIQYGIEGEENILFELKNSHFPMYVLHDIYMVDHDLSAQIDYIIITPSMVYFIECKNLIGTIMIDSMGNFTREYNYNEKIIKEGQALQKDFLEHLFDNMDTATKEAFFSGMKQIEANLDKILEYN